MVVRAVLLIVLFLAQDKPKPSPEDKKPFVSDAFLCTVHKPTGKEADWTFVSDKLGADAVVRVDHKLVMGFRCLIRCVKPQPNQKLVTDDSTVKTYTDSVMASKNFKNQKSIKTTTQTLSTGDEARVMEFEYEHAQSPDPYALLVVIFVAKANGYRYLFETTCAKNQWKLSRPQADSILSGFQPRAPK